MAQYDLHLIQNTHVSGVEFTERLINIAKGGILTANASQVPTVLPAGTDGYQLVRDDNEATGLKWVAISGGHTQGTDTGTTSTVFEIDSDGYKIELTAESASKFGVKVDGGLTYADLQAKDATFATASVSAAPTLGDHLVNKTYADGLIAAADAMVFKGTIGSGGTHEIAAFNSLATYNAGWTYRVITAGTVKGKVCEVGDLVIAMVDRAGSGNVDADFTVAQTNLDGAVIGPSSVSDGFLVLFDGITGKLIKAGTAAPGTMAYETATNYVPKSLFDAHTVIYATADNTPLALTVGEQTIVGRKTGGNIAALTGTEVMNVIWQTAPATKTSTGTAGMIAKDDNYFYVCTATDTWKRSVIATNWS